MFTILEETHNKLGDKVIIKHIKTIGSDLNVHKFYLKHMLELMENEYIESTASWNIKQIGAVCAYINDQLIGMIAYDTQAVESKQAMHLSLSAIDINHRRQGIYKLLHPHFEQVARRYGCRDIWSIVHVNNIDRINSASSVGFVPKFHIMYKKV